METGYGGEWENGNTGEGKVTLLVNWYFNIKCLKQLYINNLVNNSVTIKIRNKIKQKKKSWYLLCARNAA